MFKFLTSIFEQEKTVRHISRLEKKEIERLFASVFKTEQGQKVLAYLNYSVHQRILGEGASEAQLRHNEGQRALLHIIYRLSQLR